MLTAITEADWIGSTFLKDFFFNQQVFFLSDYLAKPENLNVSIVFTNLC